MVSTGPEISACGTISASATEVLVPAYFITVTSGVDGTPVVPLVVVQLASTTFIASPASRLPPLAVLTSPVTLKLYVLPAANSYTSVKLSNAPSAVPSPTEELLEI